MLSEYLKERKEALDLLEQDREAVRAMAERIVAVLKAGGKLLTCGNGGSAAEAQHFATELIGRFKDHRRSLPAVCLNTDGSVLTCISNDYGADAVFSRQVEGLAKPGDLLVALSTSGNSVNVLKALKTARSMGIVSAALLGRDGGACRGLATEEIIIPSQATAVIQELHLCLIHYFCERIDRVFVRNQGTTSIP